MKIIITQHGLARVLSFRLIVLTLLCLPGLLPAQALRHRYSFTNDASDLAGGANGTLIGNVSITSGVLNLPGGGTSTSPQGYVSLPNGVVSNDTSITVECWLMDNGGLVWAEAWCFGDSAAGPGQPPNYGTSYISLIPRSGANDFRAAFNLTGSDEIDVIDPAGSLPMNVEEYAVVTYDAASTTARLYLNGVQVGVANIPASLAPANYGNTFNNWVGRDEFGADPMFAGSIDELRIWNAAVSPLYIAVSTFAGPNVLVTNLTPVSVSVTVTTAMLAGQTQLATVSASFLQLTNVPVTGAATNWSSSNTNVLTVNGAGLITAVSAGSATVSATVGGIVGTTATLTVSSSTPTLPSPTAYYPLDGDVLDHSGNGYDGVNDGATFVTPAYASSEAAQFNGSGYVQIPESIGVTGTGFTIAMWVNTTDTGGGPNWYSGEGLVDGEVGGVTTDFGTALVNGKFALGIGQADTTLASTNSINDGNWHHVAATWNMTSGAMNVYVDGILSASGTGPTGARVAPPDLRIGSIQTGVAGGFLSGTIDEVLLYNSELTAPQVAALKNSYSAAPQVGTPVASPSNMVYAGTTVTLNVLVLGLTPDQYQWQKNGANIAGATAAALVLTDAMVSDSGSYDVVVGNTSGTNTSSALTVTVNPASAPIFAMQPAPATATNYLGGLVTFTASVNGSLPIQLQWQHNGVNIPYANISSLTLASLQMDEAGSYTLVASNAFGVTNSLPATLTVLPPPNPSALNVVTYHCDNTRQGANTNEVLLNLANVNDTTFGRLITYPTDGYIYAQPLYVSGLVIPGQGTHNAVIVATENDSVYAFDADSNAGTNGGLLWHTNLGIAISSYNNEFGNRYQGTYYGDIVPVVGITGTPVIDIASGTLYVDVHTREVGATTNYYHRIHALNITNGTERSYGPVVASNSVPGAGVDNVNGVVSFNPRQENQRPGLTLAGGMVYAAYGSFADTDPYHGWVLGFNATNLAQSANYAFNTTPNATIAAFGPNAAEGALWMGGNGLCVDASNNLFFVTGNGSFDANNNGGDYGDSFVKLSTTNGLTVADYFTPYNQSDLAVYDTDLGSGGMILLPDSAGSAAHPHLMVGAGKDGTLRLVDRDNLGHFNAANDNQIVQEVPEAITGSWSTPAYFNNQIYYQGVGDVMKAFLITNGVIVPTPVSRARTRFSALGGTPFISANGTNNGIVWTIQSDASGSGGPAVLHAYNATNLALELYNSSQNLARDNPGGAIKMTAPIAINGKVFVGAEYALSVFGNTIFVATPTILPNSGVFTNSVTVTLSDTTAGAAIYYTLDGSLPNTNSTLYTGPFVLTNNVSVQAVAAAPGAVNGSVASASFINSSAIGNGTGLLGQYWSSTTSVAFTNVAFNASPTLTRTDAVVNFNWGTGSPDPSISVDDFTVRWTGSVQPQFNETYTFYSTTDDGVRLWVNNQLLIDDWVDQSATTKSDSITLKAQQLYNIRMEYYENVGDASVVLQWSSPSTVQSIIPQSQLYPFANPPPAVVLTAPAGSATNLTAAASVTISADADATYNLLSKVDFYANGTVLGSVSNVPYTVTATGLAAGNFVLTAVATDSSGLSSTSAPVNITVAAGSGQAYGLTTTGTVTPFLNMPATFAGALPPLLSGTGAYLDTPNRVPTSGLIPYAPNTPLWSDAAVKSRFLALPHDGGVITPEEQIAFAPTGSWTFPAGTVFVKNFDLVVNETNTGVPLRRLETRLLVRDINGVVYGVTYKWRPDNSDADLLPGSLSENIFITNATGIRTQTWYYPSPADCLTCHTPVANYVLGVNTRQLNGNLMYAATGVIDNQLRTLNRLGLLNPAINEMDIANYEKLSALTNLSASLEERSRSYLDANCAQCHQPGGTGITFDARYDTPLVNQHITNFPASSSLGVDIACIVKAKDIWRSMIYQRMDTTNPAIKMPPVARNLIDTNAVQVFTDWINSLPGTPALAPPLLTPSGGIFTSFVSVTAKETATNATTMYYTLNGSLPTTNSTLYIGPILVSNSATVTINAWAPGYASSVADAAQYSILPGIYFTSSGGFTNGIFQMSFIGPIGSNYVLQTSSNLLQWTSISTNLPLTSPFVLSDPSPPGVVRFYRVLQEP